MKVVKWSLAGAAGLVVAGVVAFGLLGIGGAQAQTPDNKDAARSQYEQLLAQKLGISVDTLQAAQKSARDQMIDDAVAKGLITADQAAKLKSMPAAGPFFGRVRDHAKAVVMDVISAAAKTIGISNDDVKSGLQNGQTLSQIAQAHGVSRDQLTTGMTSILQQQITDALAKGTISQDVANQMLSNLSNRVNNIVDHARGDGPHGHRFQAPGTPGTPRSGS